LKIETVLLCNCDSDSASRFAAECKAARPGITIYVHAWRAMRRHVHVPSSVLSPAHLKQAGDLESLQALDALQAQETVPGGDGAPRSRDAIIATEDWPAEFLPWLSKMALFSSYRSLKDIGRWRDFVLALYSMWRVRSMRLHIESNTRAASQRVAMIVGPELPSAAWFLEATTALGDEADTVFAGEALAWPLGLNEFVCAVGPLRDIDDVANCFERLAKEWPRVLLSVTRAQEPLVSIASLFSGPITHRQAAAAAVVQRVHRSADRKQLFDLAFSPPSEQGLKAPHLLRAALVAALVAEGSDEDLGTEFAGALSRIALRVTTSLAARRCAEFDAASKWTELYDVAASRFAFFPDDLRNLYYLSRALRQLGLRQQAKFVAKRVRLLETQLPAQRWYYELAQELLRVGEWPGAIALYDAVVRSNPRNVGALTNSAICEFNAGNLVVAREKLERALTIKSDHDAANRYLAMINAREAGAPVPGDTPVEHSEEEDGVQS
jgi:tetratricopeptide (TPR) repeat protein